MPQATWLVMAAAVSLLACASAQAAPDIDQYKADALFRAGVAAAHAGRHHEAIDDFRHLLREVPTPRIKLELARSLYFTGEFDEALRLFKEVYLDPATPQTVKRNILPFMEAAELRVMRIRYGIRAITDTNPSKVGDGGTIFFNGIPLEYQPPAPKKVSYGIEPWISVERLWQNGLLTKLYGSTRLFEDKDLIAGHFQFAVAKEVSEMPGLFVQSAVEADGNKGSSYVLPSVETWKRFQLSDTAGIGIGGQVGYMKAENDDASGGFYRSYIMGDWTFLPNATIFAIGSIEHLNSRNDYYTYIAPKLESGVSFEAAGFDVSPQVTVTQTRFTQFDPFWGLKRKDITVRPAITVSHDEIEFNGFKPELNVFYEKRNSNVDLYDYDQMGGFINLRQVF